MSNTYTLTSTFVVPNDVKEENIRLVLNEFYGDLVETERFIDARIVDSESLDQAERQRLFEMLSDLDEEAVATSIEFTSQLDE